jgi:hypothetical protein
MDSIISVANSTNHNMEANLHKCEVKGSVEFHYFHSKKWATRIIYYFMRKHATATPSCLEEKETK